MDAKGGALQPGKERGAAVSVEGSAAERAADAGDGGEASVTAEDDGNLAGAVAGDERTSRVRAPTGNPSNASKIAAKRLRRASSRMMPQWFSSGDDGDDGGGLIGGGGDDDDDEEDEELGWKEIE